MILFYHLVGFYLSINFAICCMSIIDGRYERAIWSALFGVFILLYLILSAKDKGQIVEECWEYGTCNGIEVRKHKTEGNVQMILWNKGEQGYDEDYWHNLDKSYWKEFVPNIIKQCE